MSVSIGVVREIKVHENRVALTPAGVDKLVSAGHRVMIEREAGVGSGLEDDAYRAAGAVTGDDAASVWAENDLILKVKEPLADEWPMIRAGQTIFTYFHLAADRQLTQAMVDSGSHCFAYETLERDRQLPLLTPMSEVAGRMSIQAGATYLERHNEGRGILLGGVPGVPPARVLILGGGTVGTEAARMASGMGADVAIMDINLDRLRELDLVLPANCLTLYSTPYGLREELARADLVVGAVLIPGGAAPKLVSRADLKLMKPGAVIVDVAVDQGGCIETARPTTHAEPVFIEEGVVHYCVANMPGAVPVTSTAALTHATLPYTLQLADWGPAAAVRNSDELRTAANVIGGRITYGAVAEAFDMTYVPAEEAAAKIA